MNNAVPRGGLAEFCDWDPGNAWKSDHLLLSPKAPPSLSAYPVNQCVDVARACPMIYTNDALMPFMSHNASGRTTPVLRGELANCYNLILAKLGGPLTCCGIPALYWSSSVSLSQSSFAQTHGWPHVGDMAPVIEVYSATLKASGHRTPCDRRARHFSERPARKKPCGRSPDVLRVIRS